MTQDSLQLQSCIAREVKKYPCLYDPNHLGQWSPRRREPYWQAIAEAVNAAAPPSPPRTKSRFFSPGVSAMDCQRIWRLLRGRYVREVRLGTRRAPDGTLIRARSQWTLFRRLDFLRDHIKPKSVASCFLVASHSRQRDRRSSSAWTRLCRLRSRTVSGCRQQRDSEEPDANETDCAESTDAMKPALVSDNAGAERRQDNVVSPIDLEFDVSPGGSDVDYPVWSYEVARAAGSPVTTATAAATSEDGITAGGGRRPSSVQPVVPAVPPHRGTSERGTERNSLRSDDMHSRRPGRRRQHEGGSRSSADNPGDEEARKSGDLESALCRFLTATVRKVASWTPGAAESAAAGSRGRPEIRVNADDADALFLLGLRGLMGALDAQSKSRAQLDILRLLQERVAQGPKQSDDDNGADQARAEVVATGATKTDPSEVPA